MNLDEAIGPVAQRGGGASQHLAFVPFHVHIEDGGGAETLRQIIDAPQGDLGASQLTGSVLDVPDQRTVEADGSGFLTDRRLDDVELREPVDLLVS